MVTYKYSYATAKKPWFSFFFLCVIVFAVQHDWLISLANNFTILSDEELAETFQEGQLSNRISLITLGLWGLIILFWYAKPFRLNLIGMFFIFLLLWAIMSVSWSADIQIANRRVIVFIIQIIAALAIVNYFSLRNIVFWFFLSSAVYLFLGIGVEIYLGTFTPFSAEYRFAGTLHPNAQGINCIVLFISAITLAKNSYKKKLYLAISIVAIIFLLFSKSRSSIGILLLIFMFHSVFLMPVTRSYLAIFFSLTTIAVFLTLLAVNDFYSAEETILFGREDIDESTIFTLTGRIPLWESLWEYVIHRPIQGYGYGSFWVPEHILDIAATQQWPVSQAHSSYFEILLSLGFVGLGLWAVILISVLLKIFWEYKISENAYYITLGAIFLFNILNSFVESSIFSMTHTTLITLICIVFFGFSHHLRVRFSDTWSENYKIDAQL